ncbi:MAG: hypothetical protein ACNS60_18780 [Candidatus Cyclobacteriaceae bacterium M2_1C_046]
MSRKKIIFLIVAIIFILIILLFSYDISQRTTHPGSKPQLQERIKKNFEEE